MPRLGLGGAGLAHVRYSDVGIGRYSIEPVVLIHRRLNNPSVAVSLQCLVILYSVPFEIDPSQYHHSSSISGSISMDSL